MSDKTVDDITAAPNQGAGMSNKWLEEVIEKLRDPTDPRDKGIRKAARELGISHNRLLYLLAHEERLAEHAQILDRARKILGVSKSAIYDKFTGKK